jgi:predicted DNA-binding protein YlxM (UPF0122 family)
MIQQWINKVFHISNAESAPIIITLLVFVTGGILKLLSDLIVGIGRRRTIRRQFYLLSEVLAGSASVQADKYIETAEGFTLNGLKPLRMSVVDFYQPSIIKDIGYLKTFESFFEGLENRFIFRLINRQKKLDAFYDCWNALSSIQISQVRANEAIGFVLEYYNSHNEKRNKGMMEFEKLMFNLYQSLLGLPQADYAKKYYKEVTQIKEIWGKIPNSITPKIAHDHLVKPIVDLSMNNTYEGAQLIRFCLMDVESEYVNMDRMMNVYKQQLINYSEHIKVHVKNIVLGQKVLKKILL